MLRRLVGGSQSWGCWSWQRHKCAHITPVVDQTPLQSRWTSTTAHGDDGALDIKRTRKRGRPAKTAEAEGGGEAEPKRKLGRPRKTTEIGNGKTPTDDSAKQHTARKRPANILAGIIPQTSQHYKDLPSFLSYAVRTDLDETSTFYVGTHYEYTVASALKDYKFELHRTGRSNDLGIDLIGTFMLPELVKRAGRPRKSVTSTSAANIQVIVQCKALTPKPAMIRELEGAYIGAPAGWRGDNVLAVLVANRPATKGVRDALQRSRLPMALMQITADGWLKQFLWNAAAADAGLEGLGVTLKHGGANDADADGGHSIALTWMGKPAVM